MSDTESYSNVDDDWILEEDVDAGHPGQSPSVQSRSNTNGCPTCGTSGIVAGPDNNLLHCPTCSGRGTV